MLPFFIYRLKTIISFIIIAEQLLTSLSTEIVSMHIPDLSITISFTQFQYCLFQFYHLQ